MMIYTVECRLIASLLLHLPCYYQWFIYSALNKIEKSSKSLSYLLFSEHTYRHLTVSGQQKSYNYTYRLLDTSLKEQFFVNLTNINKLLPSSVTTVQLMSRQM